MADDFDVRRHFVRVTGRRENGLVEFEFSVGEPQFAVELIMPESAFEAFCAANDVVMLDTPPPHEPDSDWDWNLHDATKQRFR